jgi:hypothetical protein
LDSSGSRQCAVTGFILGAGILGSSFNVPDMLRYIKTNNPQSAYAQHILHNRHEYGTLAETMTLIKPIQNESMLLPFEQFHIQSLHQTGKLIPEQYPNDPNPLFQLRVSHPPPTRHKTEPVKQ